MVEVRGECHCAFRAQVWNVRGAPSVGVYPLGETTIRRVAQAAGEADTARSPSPGVTLGRAAGDELALSRQMSQTPRLAEMDESLGKLTEFR